MSACFVAIAREALRGQGWRVVDVPSGVTLVSLRDAGAPFKGSKYFDLQAAATTEEPVVAGEVAYRPGLMPDSLNRSYTEVERQVDDLRRLLLAGVRPTIGPAALYVWLFVEHHREGGSWPIQGCYTWAADRSGSGHLAVGVFGRERPLLVSPIPESTGRGIGVMPVLVPDR